MAATLERSYSQASGMSMSSSPLLSVHTDLTPPTMATDSRLSLAHRIGYLDSQLNDLRSTVLTSDDYVDRRNREDERVQREFIAQRKISDRIDSQVHHIDGKVSNLQTDVSRIDDNVRALQSDTAYLRSRVSHLQSNFRLLESRMAQMERVRFNSLANTIHAPLNPVPKIAADGTLRYPDWFPRSVWKFWCLKKRSRVHRLVQLAQFYELEGQEYWSRNHQELQSLDYDSDSSGSSDRPNNLSLTEATYQYPEACHQALAATLGLNYYKIRKEVGEGPPHTRMPRPPKRHLDEASASHHSAVKVAKTDRIARTVDQVSPTLLKKLVTGVPSIASKSASSEHEDKVRWRGAGSDVSDEAMSMLKDITHADVAHILRAIERGRLHVQSEQMNISPTESRRGDGVKPKNNADTSPVEEDGGSVHTISTELISPGSLPDTTSM